MALRDSEIGKLPPGSKPLLTESSGRSVSSCSSSFSGRGGQYTQPNAERNLLVIFVLFKELRMTFTSITGDDVKDLDHILETVSSLKQSHEEEERRTR